MRADLAIALPSWTAYLAVVSGALGGAIAAAKRGYDFIGVLGLALAAGLGGLLLRDILLQVGTPLVLREPWFIASAGSVAILGFFFAGLLIRIRPLLIVLDALSMGLLVTLGCLTAINQGLPFAAVIFIGVLTAVGGQLLRDILAGDSPQLLKPGVFTAVAALAGALLFEFLQTRIVDGQAQVATIVLVFALRMLAEWRKWETKPAQDLSDRVWDYWSKP